MAWTKPLLTEFDSSYHRSKICVNQLDTIQKKTDYYSDPN